MINVALPTAKARTCRCRGPRQKRLPSVGAGKKVKTTNKIMAREATPQSCGRSVKWSATPAVKCVGTRAGTAGHTRNK